MNGKNGQKKGIEPAGTASVLDHKKECFNIDEEGARLCCPRKVPLHAPRSGLCKYDRVEQSDNKKGPSQQNDGERLASFQSSTNAASGYASASGSVTRNFVGSGKIAKGANAIPLEAQVP